MEKIKILMIGWEFPPIINGGLGVACQGLSKAISSYVELTLVLPKSSQSYKLQNINIIGMNNIDIEELMQDDDAAYAQIADSEVNFVDIPFNPYPKHSAILQHRSNEGSADVAVKKKIDFNVDELYGDNVIERVQKFATLVAKLAEDIDFDIIHCHDWMTFVAGIKLKEKFKKPLIVQLHSLEYDRSGASSKNWVYQLEKAAIEKADMIIPVSNYTGEVAQTYYNADPTKIFVVHNGTAIEQATKKAKDFPEDLVLFLGRVTHQKGPQYFLEIASKVLKSYPNVRFVVAGTGDQLSELIENGAYKNIGNKFHYTGFLTKEKVQELLSMADVYCMPSVSEPFGLSALEAAQFGVPCVISKQSGVAEVLKGALKADYWDIDRMANHIISLLTNPPLRNAIIKDAFEDLKDCTWDVAAKKTLKLYQKLIASPNKL